VNFPQSHPFETWKKLTADERTLMQAHTLIVAETLKGGAEHHGSAFAFMQMCASLRHTAAASHQK
jgi:hypothetical protein